MFNSWKTVKPIVTVKVLSGEQMYNKVAHRQHHQPTRPLLGQSDTFSPDESAGRQSIKRNRNDHNSLNRSISTANYHQFVVLEEIFFNCSIKSNPDVYLVQWFHNERPLQTDLSQGKDNFPIETIVTLSKFYILNEFTVFSDPNPLT